jgi:hypothetical protein
MQLAFAPRPALVPEKVMNERDRECRRGRHAVIQAQRMDQHRHCGQLNAGAGNADGVEPRERTPRIHRDFSPRPGSGSAKYSVRVCETAETTSVTNMPAMPTTPPTSNRR